jgi:hypothetical protein
MTAGSEEGLDSPSHSMDAEGFFYVILQHARDRPSPVWITQLAGRSDRRPSHPGERVWAAASSTVVP